MSWEYNSKGRWAYSKVDPDPPIEIVEVANKFNELLAFCEEKGVNIVIDSINTRLHKIAIGYTIRT